MDEKDAARILVDDVADHVELGFGLAYLRCSHHYDVPHLRICECVHDLYQIRRALVSPGAHLGRCLS